MAEEVFTDFSEEYFNKYLELNPLSGSYLGLHQYDGKVGDFSKEGFQNEINIYKELYKQLDLINRNGLSKINQLDYDISRWSLESLLFDLEEIQAYKSNPMFYALAFSELHNYISREYAPFEERLKAVLNIIDKIPDTLKVAEINLQKTLPEVLCRYAKNFSIGYENFFQGELLKVIKERTNDKKLISKYIEKSKSAIEAFKKYIEFLDNASSEEDVSYRIGTEKFERMLQIKEHINLPVEKLKKLGLDELKRLQEDLMKVIKENNFEGKLQTLEHIHPTEDNVIKDTNETLNELIGFIRYKDLIDLPSKLNCIVTEMPKYMNFGFAAMNTVGPFEKSDESFYYVNLPDKDWDEKKKEEWLTQFNYPTLKLISIHEAYPGHYTHFLNANKYSTKLSKLFLSYSYTEGWAHYTEEMMIEQGYSKDDFKSKIGMLTEALIRCCRYIVAIGIHCENMTIKAAQKFFVEYAYMSGITALQEAERGAFDPGYLNYTLGKMYLKELREKYFAKFNGTKSLKDFHNQIVSLGAPTYRIAVSFIL